MVWLYRSPIPVGRRGVFHTFKMISTCLRYVYKRGGGGFSTLCCWVAIVLRYCSCLRVQIESKSALQLKMHCSKLSYPSIWWKKCNQCLYTVEHNTQYTEHTLWAKPQLCCNYKYIVKVVYFYPSLPPVDRYSRHLQLRSEIEALQYLFLSFQPRLSRGGGRREGEESTDWGREYWMHV